MNRLIACCLFVGLATGCAPLRPCKGTPAGVYRTCGCHPRDDAFITRVDALQVSSIVKQAARRCASGDVTLNVQGREVVEGDLAVCLEQANEIDAQSRAALLDELDNANAEAGHRAAESTLWRACYEEATGAGTLAAERTRAQGLKEALQAKDLELRQVLRLKEDLERELSTCQDQLSRTSLELTRLQGEAADLREQLKSAVVDKDGLQVQLRHNDRELEEARKTIKALTTLAERRKQQHGQDLRTIEHLERELDTVRTELQEACGNLRTAGLGQLCDDPAPRS